MTSGFEAASRLAPALSQLAYALRAALQKFIWSSGDFEPFIRQREKPICWRFDFLIGRRPVSLARILYALEINRMALVSHRPFAIAPRHVAFHRTPPDLPSSLLALTPEPAARKPSPPPATRCAQA